MTENKQFHLKIKWKNREKTEAHEIVLYDGGQPLCELISVDDARLVRDIMNRQEEEIQRLKWSNKILRANKKDCELGRREERKRWVKMDEMRIEHIRLLQKRLKKNGLSIYVNDDVDD